MSDKISSTPELYCVEIKRYARDLGISIVLPASCELMARREVMRLFPEFKHNLVLMRVFIAQYVELDWDSGRSIIIKRRRQPPAPACIYSQTNPKPKKLPRIEEEGAE